MIRDLDIRSFKSIKQGNILLGRINVFIGANGSGKSNILEAVGFLSAAASGRVDITEFQRRGIRIGNPHLYLSRFEKSARRAQIGAHLVDASYYAGFSSEPDQRGFTPDAAEKGIWHVMESYGGTGLESKSGDNVKPDDIQKDPLFQLIDKTPHSRMTIGAWLRANLDAQTPFSKLVDRLVDYKIYAPNTPVLRGTEPDRSQAEPIGLAGGRLAEAVNELLAFIASKQPPNADDEDNENNKIDELLELIPWASTLRAVSVAEAVLAREVPAPRTVLEFVDKHMHPESNRLTAYDASEGILYVLFALVVALHPKSPQLAAIDNVDQALNPRLARKLMRMLCDWTKDLAPDRQLLLTCHNPLALDGLPLLEDDVRLFAVDRNLAGHTVIHRVEITPEIKQKSQEGWTLSRMWVMGLLGGVPDV